MGNEIIRLKLCPFCNGEPILHKVNVGAVVGCKTCKAQAVFVAFDDGTEAVKYWNRRVGE